MLTEPQERWLAALESGEYKQGRCYLHSIREDGTNTFCCLGVACHIFQEELRLIREVIDTTDVVYNGNVRILPVVVQVHLKLRNELGRPIVDAQLSRLNDHCRKTFKEIATIIRENPSNFFYGD